MIDSFEGCIIGGAIGDAQGSSYENEINIDYSNTYIWGKKPEKDINRVWNISHDTQLTLATCEAIDENNFDPEKLSRYFVQYYKQNKLTGVGASTYKAITDLEAGIHWTQSGRIGEFAAGNGAAMRIAPFAFFPFITREDIYNASQITHRNDEAYVGALAIYLSIKTVINERTDLSENLLDVLIPQLPDTKIRDRFIEIDKISNKKSILEISKLGNNGYVVNSIPFAIYSATQVTKIGMVEMFEQIIKSGGDTDTNSSIAGQIAGAIIGVNDIPENLINKIQSLSDYNWIKQIIDKTKMKIKN